MAVTARELLLILRAQNQASGALRRLAGDLQGLGKVQQLHMRRNALAIQQAQIMRQRQRALNEQFDVEQGRRFMHTVAERNRLYARQIYYADQLANTQKKLIASGRREAAALARSGPQSTRYIDAAVAAENLRIRQRRLQTALNLIPAAIDANVERFVKLKKRSNELSSDLSILGQRAVRAEIQQRQLAKAITDARWDRVGQSFRAVGNASKFVQLAGLGMGAGLAFAANEAAKFQEQVMLVATQTGKIGSGFEAVVANAEVLNEAILRVASESTSSLEQLGDAAYDIFSSLTLPQNGKGLRMGTDMLKQFSDAAIAGMTDVSTVGEGVIAVLNAFEEFSPTGKDVNKILNRLFAAVRFGRMTFASLRQC